MLSVNKAHKKFGTSVVLNNIDLNIERNSIVGLAGPSGSGKSTLLRCIQNLESLDSGNIILNEKSGFMFQDFQLFPHMKVWGNLTYAPRINHKYADHNVRAMELLETLGIADKAECFPHQLSGGQKQRVALARSLMMKPKLLLCDEPTSGLDIASIEDVVALLRSIHHMGVTMMIASHDLEFLVKLTNRVVVLKVGNIVADVIPQNLENPIHYLKTYY